MATLEYGKFKPITIELSQFIDVKDMAIDLDVMMELKYEHHTKVNLGDSNEQYEMFYLTDEFIILSFTKSLYLFKLQIEAEIDDMEEMVKMLEFSTLELETEHKGSFDYTPLSTKNLKIGTEEMLSSIDDAEENSKCDIMINMFHRMLNNNIVEYLLVTVVNGELYMYVGVEINESNIV